MLTHYIKLSLKNFYKNKVVFIGSLFTLCLGGLCCAIVFSYVLNEITIDSKALKDKANTYIFVQEGVRQHDFGFYQFDNKNKYPEIEAYCYVGKINRGEIKLRSRNNIYNPQGLWVDSTFFKIFDYKLLRGNKQTILENPQNIILTESYAKKLFGNESAVGKHIILENYYKRNFTVSGIVENPTSNSSLQFDFIVGKSPMTYYLGAGYVLLYKNVNTFLFKEKIKDLLRVELKKLRKEYEINKPKTGNDGDVSIISIDQLYFKKIPIQTNTFFSRQGNLKTIYTLCIIIIVSLIISLLNLINLQIVNTNKQIKNFVVHRLNGATSKNLFSQRLTEFCMYAILSVAIIACVFPEILEMFNTHMNLKLNLSTFQMLCVISLMVFILLFISFIYPFIIAIKRSKIKSLKEKNFFGGELIGRKKIIILQYTLAFILLISSIIVIKQLYTLLHTSLGYEYKNTISVEFKLPASLEPNEHQYNNLSTSIEDEIAYSKKMFAFENYVDHELRKSPYILEVTKGQSFLDIHEALFSLKEKNKGTQLVNAVNVDKTALKVYNFKLLEGHFFEASAEFKKEENIVINEAAMKYFNFKNIADAHIYQNLNNREANLTVIGVIKDFNYQKLSVKPKPLILFNHGGKYRFIKFKEGKIKEGLAYVKKVFKENNPDEVFKYTILSNEIAQQYNEEKKLSTVYTSFTILTLFISAMGLFTIALYDTQRRKKEIGIRKVNGANTNEIIKMFNADFLKSVIVAFLIACPIAYSVMYYWLQNFAYKTILSWWLFVFTGLIVFVIAILTVSWQSYVAATVNPSKVLKDE
ncbi:ABC transporter permease [Zhouia sp. PK063]|uniref:ABC transporter permease n=1 Tax=Zhouia sp. PK063 TaxID=3373602 RepID=UPI00378CC108